MSRLILYGCTLVGCISGASAQNLNHSAITYIAEIPVIIESHLYIDQLSPDNVLHTVSGRIKVILAPRKTVVPSDQYFHAGKPLGLAQVKKIEYRCFKNNLSRQPWQSLATGKSLLHPFPDSRILADTLLRARERLVIQFRFKGTDKIIQQNIFSRPMLYPAIAGYRQKRQHDSLDNQVTSAAFYKSRKFWNGFDTSKGNQLTLLPNKPIEFLFKRLSLNRDSCILYRLRLQNASVLPEWKPTGHLLTIHKIPSNRKYWLDVRYTGADAYHTYQLTVLPSWHQTHWATGLFVVSGMFTVLGLPYGVYRYRLNKERAERIQAQEKLKTIQSQLKPHFIYNSLGSIQELIITGETEKASTYLDLFSGMMQHALRNGDEQFVSLSDEIALLRQYISIEQLRFDFRYQVRVDPLLIPETIEFPPMLLQPTVENAVRHGVAGMGNEGYLDIAFIKQGADLEVRVQDNGIHKTVTTHRGHGQGIQLTRDRIESLKKLYRSEPINYRLTHTPTGTIVQFTFKNWIH